MGITWRFTMPLLSTLAALVIIVHSAEEDLDRDYRYEVRPRPLDTRPSSYEEPWRVAEPIMQQSELSKTWNNEPDDMPVRRRTGRKRKRRPPADYDDGVQESRNYDVQDAIRHDFSSEVPESTEMPRRRRKKLNKMSNRWAGDPVESDIPVRRRLQRRRKRPLLDNWPELSEFGGLTKDPEQDTDREEAKDIRINSGNDDETYNRFDDDDKYVDTEINTRLSRPKSKFAIENSENKKPKEDKSLSEFSSEIMSPMDSKNDDVHSYVPYTETKVKHKPRKVLYEQDKAQEDGSIDPHTLKELLKRSNGTSLSEILQQHNLTLADLLSKKENAIALLKSQSLQDLNKNETQEDNIRDKNVNPKKDLAYESDAKLSEMKLLIKEKDETTKNITKEYSHLNSSDSLTQIVNNTEAIDTQNPNIITHPEVVHLPNSMNAKHRSPGGIRRKLYSYQYSSDNVTPIVNNTDTLDTHNKNQNITVLPEVENLPNVMIVKHRVPGGIRRKLRMRPTVNNNSYKSPLNRDMIALTTRRFVHHRRNFTKAKGWKDMIPLMPEVNTTSDIEHDEEVTTITTSMPEDITTIDSENDTILPSEDIITSTTQNETPEPNPEITETTTIPIEIINTEYSFTVTELPMIVSSMRNTFDQTGLRRQAYNNRLKRKRLKHKTSTTEAPENNVIKNVLNLGDFVSSSEFIARTQLPKFTNTEGFKETATELEDFLTTESIKNSISDNKNGKINFHKSTSSSSTTFTYPSKVTTEQTAKFEIQEILNDTRTSAKLSNILRERNMTLGELLDHRERGSSHVHLADIFHNASREPNPPEPFLSKSLLEPISKETYPLRALLEANLHETKVTTEDPNVMLINHLNIPVIMDFGNNVNENADTMGITSLFNNTKKDFAQIETITIQKDSEGTPYQSTIIKVNTSNDENDARESRMLDGDDQEDLPNWNEIFGMIRKHKTNGTASEGNPTEDTEHKFDLKEELNGNSLVEFEDMPQLNVGNIDASNSEDNIEFNSYENEIHDEKAPSGTKSVMIATASIVGIAMVLFLLTYGTLKWKQQRALIQKHGYHEERIPSPVFENRKVKKNCSNRSISPMLTSNIYTMSTLESQNGKDSPEYMWDTLRKPFQ